MPERQVVGWFEVDEAQRAACQPDKLPVFCIGDDKNAFYGASLTRKGKPHYHPTTPLLSIISQRSQNLAHPLASRWANFGTCTKCATQTNSTVASLLRMSACCELGSQSMCHAHQAGRCCRQ